MRTGVRESADGLVIRKSKTTGRWRELISSTTIYKILFFTWLIFVIWLLTVPFPKMPLPKHSDKVIHFTIFLISSFLFYLAYRKEFKHIFLLSFFLPALVGTGLEFVQYFLPYRTFSLMDIVANLVGITFSCIMIILVRSSLLPE